MAFVKRDETGAIEAITLTPTGDKPEVVDPTSGEVITFLFGGDPQEGAQESWITADLSLARVVEDVVDVLIKKKLIEITDFPIPAQQKLISRRGKRNDYGYLTELFPEDEEDEELFA
ncbi:MAG: hypothetical protein HOG95_18020 [Rhodospirillaceae bacterium]|jgi:hypothetical protein|nr:hypothetical protein [Rhodospirillaceae bacterium]MBT5941829.1 hypothetical protein [Rhodospirillaceae bacterium]MBT7268761.1 hypothetical protein [Rhodospirillaceae bacterium]